VDVTFTPASGGVNHDPVAANDNGFSVTQNTPLSFQASLLLSNDHDPDGDSLTISGVSDGVNGTVAFNAQTNTITFTPNHAYTGAAAFNYAISDGHGGTATATANLSVNSPATPAVSLFSTNSTPSMISVSDPGAIAETVELGFKFQAASNGDITGIRF